MIPTLQERTSGILYHPGTLGPDAYRFVDFLAHAGQRWWQMLPLGPRGACRSPYDSPSAFAGDPQLIYVDKSSAQVPRAKDFARFLNQNRFWIDDFALFTTLKEKFNQQPWNTWPEGLRQHRASSLAQFRRENADRIQHYQRLQYHFERQWLALKRYAQKKNVGLIGDVAIFVSHESADVWAHQDLFQIDSQGQPLYVSGVPPDYFSATGQRWGNPLYRWDRLKKTGYAWWVARLRAACRRFDVVRLDHFIGFLRYWEIPAKYPTAEKGRYRAGPGSTFFDALKRAMGTLPLIAEDLGVVIPEVKALRDRYDLPGMRILQFAFGEDPEADNYKPHNYPKNCVVYTGTHDNDTTVGWFKERGGKTSTRSASSITQERQRAMAYIPSDGRQIHWDMIRLALRSAANVAIIPVQDILGLGSQARTNRPGTCEGNWSWRLKLSQLRPALARRLLALTQVYGRTR